MPRQTAKLALIEQIIAPADEIPATIFMDLNMLVLPGGRELLVKSSLTCLPGLASNRRALRQWVASMSSRPAHTDRKVARPLVMSGPGQRTNPLPREGACWSVGVLRLPS